MQFTGGLWSFLPKNTLFLQTSTLIMNFLKTAYQNLRLQWHLSKMQQEATRGPAHQYAKSTIFAISELYKHRNQLAKLTGDALDSIILKITKLYPEPGLIYGQTPRHRKQSIVDITKMLVSTYLTSKKEGRKQLFF